MVPKKIEKGPEVGPHRLGESPLDYRKKDRTEVWKKKTSKSRDWEVIIEGAKKELSQLLR